MADVKNKICLLTDLQCFANIDYYSTLESYDVLQFEQYEHYQKRTYANRYYIAGPNGRLLLTVPLLHNRRERTAVRDLRICNRDRWQALHWKTLLSAYRRSPWFEFYESELSVMYNKKYEYIWDWNWAAFEMVRGWLGKSWAVSLTASYEKTPDGSQVVDARHRIVPPAAEAPLSENGRRYPQVFADRNGFIPGLSILDLLFCEGKHAGRFLAVAGGG